MKVLMEILITDMWTPDYTAQYLRVENTVDYE